MQNKHNNYDGWRCQGNHWKCHGTYKGREIKGSLYIQRKVKRFLHVHHNYPAHKRSVHWQEAHINSSIYYAIITLLLTNSFSYTRPLGESNGMAITTYFAPQMITGAEVVEWERRNEITFPKPNGPPLRNTRDFDCPVPSKKEKEIWTKEEEHNGWENMPGSCSEMG